MPTQNQQQQQQKATVTTADCPSISLQGNVSYGAQ